jgi:SlyX protein
MSKTLASRTRTGTRRTWTRLDLAGAGGHDWLMNEDVSARLSKIESHVAHLEHQVEQMNTVIIEQGKLVERLKKDVHRQSTAMESLELERIKANNPRPPHYQ